MLKGRFRYQNPDGRIGGWRDSEGNYYIGEGHHRMRAALEILEETGDDSHVRALLENGLWAPGCPPPSSIGPLP